MNERPPQENMPGGIPPEDDDDSSLEIDLSSAAPISEEELREPSVELVTDKDRTPPPPTWEDKTPEQMIQIKAEKAQSRYTTARDNHKAFVNDMQTRLADLREQWVTKHGRVAAGYDRVQDMMQAVNQKHLAIFKQLDSGYSAAQDSINTILTLVTPTLADHERGQMHNELKGMVEELNRTASRIEDLVNQFKLHVGSALLPQGEIEAQIDES